MDDTEIEEYKFHQHKSPMLINDTYINEIVVSIKFLFGKQDFINISLVTKIIKKLDLKYNSDSELKYNKKYLKTEKWFNTKESFKCSYMPVILLDSV